MEYYSAIIKKYILTFATTWMDLEDIRLSDISQAEKDKYLRYHLHLEMKNSQIIKTEYTVTRGISGGWGELEHILQCTNLQQVINMS